MPIATFSLVALDCPDPRLLADFYMQITGGHITQETAAEDWFTLHTDSGSNIGFQRDADYEAPGWPNGASQQAHLDFDVEDLDEGERAVLAIGARKAEVQPQPTRWRVFFDPAGHPFCLVGV